MILKSLCDYYDRKAELPKEGLELKEIGFIIVIDERGQFLRFEDRRIDDNHSQKFLVRKSVERTSGIKANFLYDNSAYVLGYSQKKETVKRFNAFKARVEEIYNENPNNVYIKAIHGFYQNEHNDIISTLQKDPLWSDIIRNLNKTYSYFSFLIEGDTMIVAEKQELLSLSETSDKGIKNICLVTGEKSCIVEITTSTMIPGSDAKAKLVSFQVKSGYDSYGKVKGLNAPISKLAEFKYTTALNDMLRADSRNKFHIGNRTFIFWASHNNNVGQEIENGIFEMFGAFNDDVDDPDRNIEQVRKVFNAVYSGALQTSLEEKFFILGLAPNKARIAVVYWAEMPLKEFSRLICSHFNDMEIVDTRNIKKPYVGLRSMLSAITLGGKSTDVTPNLPETVIKSILQALPYPQPLFTSCINRIRAEQTVKITRAAIIKACLNRMNENTKKIQIMLDKENNNQGYLCGRLFAVLEKIQEEANNMHTIRERYMNSASTTPAMIFPTILNLSSHHSEKLNEARCIWFEKTKQEIIEKIYSDGFPVHLNLQDQGRFFVGYYHQRQDFFIKKNESDSNNE